MAGRARTAAQGRYVRSLILLQTVFLQGWRVSNDLQCGLEHSRVVKGNCSGYGAKFPNTFKFDMSKDYALNIVLRHREVVEYLGTLSEDT